MSADTNPRTIVVVDDDHEYKAILRGNLSEFDVRFWGCRPEKCKECEDDQPFEKAVDFIRELSDDPQIRLAAIVLDVNEFQNDEYSIKNILPALQNDSELNSVPVIVYSVRHLPEQDRRAMRAGAADFYNRTKTPPREAAEIVRRNALP